MMTSRLLASTLCTVALACGAARAQPAPSTARFAQAPEALPSAAAPLKKAGLPEPPEPREESEPPPAGWETPPPAGSPALQPAVRLRHLPPLPPAPLALPQTSIPPPSQSGAGAVVLDNKAEAYRRTEAARRAALGRRLLERRQYGQAARQHALGLVFDPRAEQLLLTAEACHRADLDLEALALYQQLQREAAPGTVPEVAELIGGLQEKIEDADFAAPRALRAHLEQGRRFFQEGQFLLAAEEYALAYAMKPLPRLLFNIAQAYRRASRMDEAYVLYARFLKDEQQTPLRKEASGYVAELRSVAFRPPVYKRAWLWGLVGTAAAVLAAGSAGLAVGLRPKYPQTDAPPEVLSFGLLVSH